MQEKIWMWVMRKKNKFLIKIKKQKYIFQKKNGLNILFTFKKFIKIFKRGTLNIISLASYPWPNIKIQNNYENQ